MGDGQGCWFDDAGGFRTGSHGVGIQPIPDDLGQFGHERFDGNRRRGRRHEHHRHSNRDHAVHPGHGDADDHGQQAGVDDGSSPSLRGRLDHLRRRFSDNGVRSQSCGSADRMVVPRRRRCGTHHARDRRARRHQLSGAEAPGCLRSGRCRRRDGRGGRAADRRRRDDICVMALRVRRRSRDRCP